MIVVSIVDEQQRGAALGAAAYLVKPVGRGDCSTPLLGWCPPSGRAPTWQERSEDVTTGRRVLVVEDNPRNLKLVRDVLTHYGFEVIEATRAKRGSASPRK